MRQAWGAGRQPTPLHGSWFVSRSEWKRRLPGIPSCGARGAFRPVLGVGDGPSPDPFLNRLPMNPSQARTRHRTRTRLPGTLAESSTSSSSRDPRPGPSAPVHAPVRSFHRNPRLSMNRRGTRNESGDSEGAGETPALPGSRSVSRSEGSRCLPTRHPGLVVSVGGRILRRVTHSRTNPPRPHHVQAFPPSTARRHPT